MRRRYEQAVLQGLPFTSPFVASFPQTMTTNKDPESTATAPSDIPAQVFHEFLERLGDAKTPAVIIDRLRVILESDKPFTEKAITDALFAEEQLP